jgi:hypothetical protein
MTRGLAFAGLDVDVFRAIFLPCSPCSATQPQKRRPVMGKSKDVKKEEKKKPEKSLKEKRLAKQAKKASR